MLILPQPLIVLWLVHPGDLLGEPIQFFSHGKFTHAGWLRRDYQTINECYMPRVRQRKITDAEKPLIKLFRLEGMDGETADGLERFFDLSILPQFAESYSIEGLFGYVLNQTPQDEQSVFCSEYVMQTCRKICSQLLPLVRVEDFEVSPASLSWSPRLIEVEWGDLK